MCLKVGMVVIVKKTINCLIKKRFYELFRLATVNFFYKNYKKEHMLFNIALWVLFNFKKSGSNGNI